jgi:predicted transcriptional regulator
MGESEEQILQYLEENGPQTKWNIEQALGLSFSQADQMLRNLRKAGLVELVHSVRHRLRGDYQPYKWRAAVDQYCFPFITEEPQK